MSDAIHMNRAQHESTIAIMQALEDNTNTRMRIEQAKDTANVVVSVTGDVDVELDREGEIVRVITSYRVSIGADAALEHYSALTQTVVKVKRAVAQKHEGRIKPWQPSH